MGSGQGRSAAWLLAVMVLVGFGPSAPARAQEVGAEAADRAGPVRTAAATFSVESVLDGLSAPVAMAVLRDGRALLAERSAARLSIVDLTDGAHRALAHDAPVEVRGDGGLLDIIVDPERPDGGVYLAYTSRVAGDLVTVVDRARVRGERMVERERLFEATPMPGDTTHYGGRLVLHDGYLFVTLGERYDLDEAQSLASYNGTVVRLHPDGSVPADNPFVGVPGALPAVWSYGHRNAQGMAVHPETGSLWLNEHGPQGGDELNIVRPGANYGWPRVTWGEEYGGGPIGDGAVERPGLAGPIWYWRPSIGPSDMVFVDGERGFPGWGRSVLVGALGLRHLSRVVYDGDRVIHVEPLLGDREWRVRMVEQAPDGSIYLGTDSGLLVRLREVRPAG